MQRPGDRAGELRDLVDAYMIAAARRPADTARAREREAPTTAGPPSARRDRGRRARLKVAARRAGRRRRRRVPEVSPASGQYVSGSRQRAGSWGEVTASPDVTALDLPALAARGWTGHRRETEAARAVRRPLVIGPARRGVARFDPAGSTSSGRPRKRCSYLVFRRGCRVPAAVMAAGGRELASGGAGS